ncbi:GerAB/ArcD/ProY family transporter [Paenibacillus qinlingensis]|uniref:GerAB/ArcD/ProY family transporter n=1 Tax=Paenibacillus qinlingensis TaxID=1837343 RepID=UPI0015679402|nr:endospore germination permease [Paenibacillus qinlingensis]NQX58770.1 endospore germination permease [Paenibacillus qinlingensis]
MIEKGRISPMQMALIMHPTIMATAALSVPSITMRVAGTDMWMAPILSSLVGLLTIYIVYHLHMKFPNETFVQYVPRIVGRFAGALVSLAYVIAFLYSASISVREYGEFISGNFLMNTPMLFVVIPIIAVCAYALYEGLEVLARSTQILIPVAIFIIVAMVIALIPDFQLKQMQPIFGNGPLPPLLGSIVPASWFSQFFILSFLYPYLNKKEHAMKWSIYSVLAVMVTMLAINFPILLTFGALTPAMNYPFLVAVRYIALSDFAEHLESLLMAIWLIGIFVKIAMVYYLVLQGTAQLFKLSDYRPIIIPIGFLVILCSIWISPTFQEMNHALSTSIPFFSLLMQVVIPACLLVTVVVKGRILRR